MFTRRILALVSALIVVFALFAGPSLNGSSAKASVGNVPAAPPAAAPKQIVAQSSDKAAAQAGAMQRPPSAYDPRQRIHGQPPQLNVDHPGAAGMNEATDHNSNRNINSGGASSPATSDWQQVAGPPAGSDASYLSGVSMPADNYGWAVGYYGYNTMIEHWDGSSWSVFYTGTLTNSYGAALYTVDSISTIEAYAVGYNQSDYFSTQQPFILRWDGTSWSQVNTGITSTSVTFLYGVKEISSNDVWVVGYNYSSGTTPITYHYDGSSWSQIAAPNPTGNCQLQSVAGSSPTAVWAAGYCYDSNYNNATSLILRWNGSSWSQDTVPGVGTQSHLNSVVSVNPSSAWAFGYSLDSNYNESTLVLHWDGSTWVQQNSPNGSDPSTNELYGATAVSPTELWAVGNGRLNAIRLHTTDGGNTWMLVDGPSGRAALSAVAASSPTNVMSVGCLFYCYHTRVEQWNGTSWNLLPNYPIVGEDGVYIENATALDANHAWAVGEYNDGNPLIYTWDGASWSAISTTLVPAGANQVLLHDVSADSPNDVWVVGDYLADYYTGIVLHYDGTAWTQMPGSEYLNGVAAISPSDVWGIDYNIIRHYDGSSWSSVSYPSPGGSVHLYSIRARAANDIWAVGYTFNNGTRTPVSLHYTDAWRLVPSTGNGIFFSIAPISANEVWAGGVDQSYNPMAQRWSHSTNRWTVVDNGLPSCCELWKMSGTGSNDVWAVSGGITVHWDGTIWTQDFYYPRNTWNISDEAVASYGNQNVWVIGSYSSGYSNLPLIAVHPANAVPTPTAIPSPTPTTTPTLGPDQFYDVPPSSLWYTFVTWLAQHGIVSGVTYGYYEPNANTTRAQFTKMVVAGFGYPLLNPPTPTFSDVPTTYWAYQFIETAHAHNVIGGYSQAQCQALNKAYPCFGPNDNITRAQIVIIVINAKGWTLITPPNPTFSDVPNTSYAYAAVETAVAHGVISGFIDNSNYHPCADAGVASPCFRPNNNATRGQLAKILYLTLNAPADTPTPTASATQTPTATNTALPTSTTTPTNTPGGSTNTPQPTNTLVPSTNTPLPPSSTPVPSTNTPGGPTNTPTNTPTPTPLTRCSSIAGLVGT